MKKTKPKIIHYCNSPTRYLHGLVTEVDHQNLPFLYRLVLPFFKWWLRLLDLNAANNLTKKGAIWIANSNFDQQMIKDIYKVNSQTIYPPIELDYFFNLKRFYKPKAKEILLEKTINSNFTDLESKSFGQKSDSKIHKKLESLDSRIKHDLEVQKEISQNFDLTTKNEIEEKITNQKFGDNLNWENSQERKYKVTKEDDLAINSQTSDKLENDLEILQGLDLTTKSQIRKYDLDKKLEEKYSISQNLQNLELIKKLENEDYYYYFGRISFHKRIDLAILSCLKLGKKLKICGASAFPAEMDKLKNLVTDFETKNPDKINLVEFLGRLENEKRDLYLQYARGFIFPAKEDFGIAPVEVLASGTPIIAYKAGGALEYVIEKKTENLQDLENLQLNSETKNNFNGVFFEEQSAESLCEAILEFEKIETWNADFIRQSVLRFDQKYFRESIEKLVKS